MAQEFREAMYAHALYRHPLFLRGIETKGRKVGLYEGYFFVDTGSCGMLNALHPCQRFHQANELTDDLTTRGKFLL